MLPDLQKIAASYSLSSQATHVHISGKSCVQVDVSVDLWLRDADSCTPKSCVQVDVSVDLWLRDADSCTPKSCVQVDVSVDLWLRDADSCTPKH